jgi:glucose-6-phosphate isomerase
MRAMSEQLHAGALRGSTGARITDIVNIGIGGSEFGARLLCDALQDLALASLRVHFVSNLDALQITRLLGKLNAGSTLFVVSSKSFGTVETLLNARTLRRWFDGFGLKMEDHWFAVTGKAAAAEAIGIPAANVLDVPEWVGGRFSPWGAVGLPAALMLGWPVYEQWLRGGAAADEHFATAPARDNLPMRLALDNVWHSTFLGCQTHCIAAYDDRLAAFITWAQQLEMESNGKSVSEDGVPLDYDTAPVVWGGLGNNGQHTYFQLLREGTMPKAVTLIGCRTASAGYADHADELHAHLGAQADALSRPGSTRGFNSLGMLMLDDLDPFHLGALMATFEHATACAGWLWGVNSFDQPGVELGKKLAAQFQRKAG